MFKMNKYHTKINNKITYFLEFNISQKHIKSTKKKGWIFLKYGV